MSGQKFTSPTLHCFLIAAVTICLIFTCTACGCLSFPSGQDGGTYQLPAFEPTVRPIHTPVPSPTIVAGPTKNQTTEISLIAPPG